MIGYDESELMDGDTSVLPMSGLPLGGIRVLDLSGPLGSYCARLLADAGADVVKAEPPEGDPLRRRPPFAGDRADPEGSLSFAYYHANKRGVVLDYRRPEAADVLAELGGPGHGGLLDHAVRPDRTVPDLAGDPPDLARNERADVHAGTARGAAG